MQRRTLIIDNHDSFTYNIYQYCIKTNNKSIPIVVANDQFPWPLVSSEFLQHFHNIIISPGPGHPDNPKDFGICKQLLDQQDLGIPILGICLGHQGIASRYGAKIVRAAPVHGRDCQMQHTETSDLFAGIPASFRGVRYHSLAIDPSTFPHDELNIIASSVDDRIIMAIQHKIHPIYGIQFHPESIQSEYGVQIIDNFQTLTDQFWTSQKAGPSYIHEIPRFLLDANQMAKPASNTGTKENHASNTYFIRACRVEGITAEAVAVFESIYGTSIPAVWLDSASVVGKSTRFSYMGDTRGPNSLFFSYNVITKRLKSTRNQVERVNILDIPLLDWMQHTLDEYVISKAAIVSSIDASKQNKYDSKRNLSPSDIPFDYQTGFVGYIGYEMKQETLLMRQNNSSCIAGSNTPDASFLFLDRVLVVDHLEHNIWLLELCKDGDTNDSGWISRTISALQSIAPRIQSFENMANDSAFSARKSPIDAHITHPKDVYISNINACRDKIAAGDSYELCLTTKIKLTMNTFFNNGGGSHYALYKNLRTRNPAPYSSFIAYSDSFSIASSSPERFLSIAKDGTITMKPIKGTISRGITEAEDIAQRQKLRSSVKDCAENLMIVDLIRNDLNTVCEPDSVCVPGLMEIESFAHVHQMVSTVQGKVACNLGVMDVIKHTFPPGSMTGAPKLSSVELLEGIEDTARGIYSGILGWISVKAFKERTSACDMSVVIRTAVCVGDDISIGAGGAITWLSEPEEEFEEMILKATSRKKKEIVKQKFQNLFERMILGKLKNLLREIQSNKLINYGDRIRYIKSSAQFLLVASPALTAKYGIDSLIWKSGVYPVVALAKQNPSLDCLEFLNDCYKLFLGLINDFEVSYYLVSSDRHPVPPWHKYVCYIGDIARYKAMLFNQTDSMDIAVQHYKLAIFMSPNNGFYYSQLAFLCSNHNQGFIDAIYYYLRCFTVKTPFLSARQSLSLLFQHIASTKSSASSFELEFIRAIHPLYSKINLDDFPKLWSTFENHIFPNSCEHYSRYAAICVALIYIQTDIDFAKLEHFVTLFLGFLRICVKRYSSNTIEVRAATWVMIGGLAVILARKELNNKEFRCSFHRLLKAPAYSHVWNDLISICNGIIVSKPAHQRSWINIFQGSSTNFLPRHSVSYSTLQEETNAEQLDISHQDWEFIGFEPLRILINPLAKSPYANFTSPQIKIMFDQFMSQEHKSSFASTESDLCYWDDRVLSCMLILARGSDFLHFDQDTAILSSIGIEFEADSRLDHKTSNVENKESSDTNSESSDSSHCQHQDSESELDDNELIRDLRIRRKELGSRIPLSGQSLIALKKNKDAITFTTKREMPISGQSKLVFDTNYFLGTHAQHTYRIIESRKWDVYIPLTVITELGGLSKSERSASLDDIADFAKFSITQPFDELPGCELNVESTPSEAKAAIIRIEHYIKERTVRIITRKGNILGDQLKNLRIYEDWGDFDTNADAVILESCKNLAYPTGSNYSNGVQAHVFLCTGDKNLRVKAFAAAMGVVDDLKRL